MFEEIVTEIAVDFCADGFANLAKIDNPHIDIVQFRFADSERINFRQRNGKLSARALTFF